MRETGGSEEEGQIMGELGGRGLVSRKAEAEMSMVQSEATIISSETLASWIYASFTAVSVYSDEFLVQVTRTESAQVEEDRSTSVSPVPEFGKTGSSEPAEFSRAGAFIEVGSCSNLTTRTTRGGIPTSSS
jgi:hypothetical protein